MKKVNYINIGDNKLGVLGLVEIYEGREVFVVENISLYPFYWDEASGYYFGIKGNNVHRYDPVSLIPEGVKPENCSYICHHSENWAPLAGFVIVQNLVQEEVNI